MVKKKDSEISDDDYPGKFANRMVRNGQANKQDVIWDRNAPGRKRLSIIEDRGSGAQGDEPCIEIIDKKESIVMITELRGFKLSDIKINTDGSRLNILASGAGGPRSRSITMPSAITPYDCSATYNNGVLEVTFMKGYYNWKGFMIIEVN